AAGRHGRELLHATGASVPGARCGCSARRGSRRRRTDREGCCVMTRLPERAPRALDELHDALERIDSDEVRAVVDAIVRARGIHVIGVGREGLMARAFTMRLMHAGRSAHWVWDDTT